MMKYTFILRSILVVCSLACLYLLSQSKLIVDMTLLGQQRHKLEFPNMPNPCGNENQRKAKTEDILCMKRPVFLPNYKNPCWRDKERLRCLPYFHIIGVAKSASTDLFKRITKHPDVIEIKGLRGKETWYWSWRRYGYGHGDPMDFFDFHRNYGIPQNDPNAEELKWTTPYLIKHVNPDVKLLLVLRDPIEMLYSYYFYSNQGESSLDFQEDVIKSMGTRSDCTKFHSHRHCLYDLSVLNKIKVRLNRAFYSSHLKEWLKVMIFRTEDYKKDIRGTLQLIFDFLNLPSLSHNIMDLIAQLPKMHVTEQKAKTGLMLPETKRMLVQFYRNSTIELAELLNDDRFAFKDASFAEDNNFSSKSV